MLRPPTAKSFEEWLNGRFLLHHSPAHFGARPLWREFLLTRILETTHNEALPHWSKQMANEDNRTPDSPLWWHSFANPVVIIAITILVAIFVLIGSAIMGHDAVLTSMARAEYARGLITYLFAVVTIGTAVVLVVSALTGTESDAHEKRFQRGKEILSLLLGVFGTIVGFYFGSEVSGAQAKKTVVQLTPPHLSISVAEGGSQVNLETMISGGMPPYRIGVAFDGEIVQTSDRSEMGGLYSKVVTVPNVDQEKAVTVHVLAIDGEGNRGEAFVPLVVKPSPKTK
jgi:hypothetical protein